MQTLKEIHGNHLLIIEVKYMLCLMYGNIGGYHYKGKKIYSRLLISIIGINNYLELDMYYEGGR